MKKAFVRKGMCLLLAGMLAACNGSDDIVNTITIGTVPDVILFV